MDTCVFTETRPEARTKHRSAIPWTLQPEPGQGWEPRLLPAQECGERARRIHSERGPGEPCAHGPVGTLPSQDHTTTSHCPPSKF